MSEPIVITVKQYVCPHCHLGRSKPGPVVRHITRCWRNPDLRSCKSCANYETSPDYGPCFPGEYCSCGAPAHWCTEEVELPDFGEREGFPIVGCPLWKLKAGEPS